MLKKKKRKKKKFILSILGVVVSLSLSACIYMEVRYDSLSSLFKTPALNNIKQVMSSSKKNSGFSPVKIKDVEPSESIPVEWRDEGDSSSSMSAYKYAALESAIDDLIEETN